MVILRFYAQDGYLQPIAKYIHNEKDPGTEKIKSFCRPIVAGLAKATEPMDVMNARIVDMDRDLVKIGFERVGIVTEIDYDLECKRSYDVVMDPTEKTITVLTFAVERLELEDGGWDVRKVPRGKEVIGQVQT